MLKKWRKKMMDLCPHLFTLASSSSSCSRGQLNKQRPPLPPLVFGKVLWNPTEASGDRERQRLRRPFLRRPPSMRGRGYSRSPSPPRGFGRRGRSPSPRRSYRGRSPSPRRSYRGRDRDLPTSLLVRNLHRNCRPDDLRRPFGRFGPLKDIYLPRDYHTREPRGFGFIQYVDPHDAAEAKYHMDGQMLLGRELTVVYAEENRKKPTEMRARERRGCSYDYRKSPRHSRSRSYSRSPQNGRYRSRSYSASPRERSVSPQDRIYRERSYSGSPVGGRSRSRSPVDYLKKANHRERSLSVNR